MLKIFKDVEDVGVLAYTPHLLTNFYKEFMKI